MRLDDCAEAVTVAAAAGSNGCDSSGADDVNGDDGDDLALGAIEGLSRNRSTTGLLAALEAAIWTREGRQQISGLQLLCSSLIVVALKSCSVVAVQSPFLRQIGVYIYDLYNDNNHTCPIELDSG